jgi:hypothetical protein
VGVEQEEEQKTIQPRLSYTSIIQFLSYQPVPVDTFFCKDVMNFKFQRELILYGRPVNNAADKGRNVSVIFGLTLAEVFNKFWMIECYG